MPNHRSASFRLSVLTTIAVVLGLLLGAPSASAAVKAKVTTQPRSVSVVVGNQAHFAVRASGSALTYQWLAKAPGAKKWTAIAKATKRTYVVKASVKRNGTRFAVRVRSGRSSVYSKAAKLTVLTKAKLVTQPRSTTTTRSGRVVTLTATATGKGMTFQWQRRLSTNGYDVSAWRNVSGATASSYTFTAASRLDAATYRLRVTNRAGTVYSRSTLLTVRSIATDPLEAGHLSTSGPWTTLVEGTFAPTTAEFAEIGYDVPAVPGTTRYAAVFIGAKVGKDSAAFATSADFAVSLVHATAGNQTATPAVWHVPAQTEGFGYTVLIVDVPTGSTLTRWDFVPTTGDPAIYYRADIVSTTGAIGTGVAALSAP